VSPSPELLEAAKVLLATRSSVETRSHCERVASTAASLARRFGVDGSDAELAGLLHDCARDESDEGLQRLATELGVPVTPFELIHPALLHARVGAAIARRDLPGIGEAVLSAVEVHTVGGIPMTDLDRVVFLADMIEPERTYGGVEDLREACDALPLAECFRIGYGRTIRHVLAQGHPLHPISVAVGAGIERETGLALFDPPAVPA
jgi:predicted HD superfamily hydrolase involved in NAD metabolism